MIALAFIYAVLGTIFATVEFCTRRNIGWVITLSLCSLMCYTILFMHFVLGFE